MPIEPTTDQRYMTGILIEKCAHVDGDACCRVCLTNALAEAGAFQGDGNCALCGLATNPFGANPGRWATFLPDPKEPGTMRPHHVACVADRVYPDPPKSDDEAMSLATAFSVVRFLSRTGYSVPQMHNPNECPDCPFATVNPEKAEGPSQWSGGSPNPADPGEGYYDCALLDKKAVWGENPICEDQWAPMARRAFAVVALHVKAKAP